MTGIGLTELISLGGGVGR